MSLADNDIRKALGTPTAALVVGAGVAFAAVYALLEWAVLSPSGQRIDHGGMLWIRELGSTRTGPTILASVQHRMDLWLIGLVAVAGIGLTGTRRRARLLGALTCLVTVPLAAELMKTHLLRPAFDGWAADNSFPSGTTAGFAAIAAALTCVAQRGWQRWVAGAAWAVAAAGGYAVISLSWHRPSDVLAALLLGAGVACLSLALIGQGEQAARSERLQHNDFRLPVQAGAEE